jgi:hypothetical protein
MKRARDKLHVPSAIANQVNTHKKCKAGADRLFPNFKAAVQHYKFPGSHQVGSYGKKGQGVKRTYSNGTVGKDIMNIYENVFLYRLKQDVKLRAQFEINRTKKRPVHVFRKIEVKQTKLETKSVKKKKTEYAVRDCGLFFVDSYVSATAEQDSLKFGSTFVRFVKV